MNALQCSKAIHNRQQNFFLKTSHSAYANRRKFFVVTSATNDILVFLNGQSVGVHAPLGGCQSHLSVTNVQKSCDSPGFPQPWSNTQIPHTFTSFPSLLIKQKITHWMKFEFSTNYTAVITDFTDINFLFLYWADNIGLSIRAHKSIITLFIPNKLNYLLLT